MYIRFEFLLSTITQKKNFKIIEENYFQKNTKNTKKSRLVSTYIVRSNHMEINSLNT